MPTNHELLDHRAIAGTILEEDIDPSDPANPGNVAWAAIAQAHALLDIGDKLTDIRRHLDDGFELLAATPEDDIELRRSELPVTDLDAYPEFLGATIRRIAALDHAARNVIAHWRPDDFVARYDGRAFTQAMLELSQALEANR